jgi:hypothetical protein
MNKRFEIRDGVRTYSSWDNLNEAEVSINIISMKNWRVSFWIHDTFTNKVVATYKCGHKE